MTTDLRSAIVLCSLLLLIQGISGAQWSRNSIQSHMAVYVCVGDSVVLDWRYMLEPGDQVQTINWMHADNNGVFAGVVATSYNDKLVINPFYYMRVEPTNRMPGIVLMNVVVDDAGTYYVEVFGYKDKAGYFQLRSRVKLHVIDQLLPTYRQVIVTMTSEAVLLDPANNQFSMKLTCGTFPFSGNSPFIVQWVTPFGQILPSSGFQEDQFYLLLQPEAVEDGIYICRVVLNSAAYACLHSSGSVGQASLYLSKTDVRFTILESKYKKLQQQLLMTSTALTKQQLAIAKIYFYLPTLQKTDDDNLPTMQPTDNDNLPTMQPTDDDNMPTLQQTDDDNLPTMQHTNPPTIQQTDDDNLPTMQPTDDDNMPTLQQTDDDNLPTTQQVNDVSLPTLQQTDDVIMPTMQKTDDVILPTMQQTDDVSLPTMQQTDDVILPTMQQADDGLLPTTQFPMTVPYLSVLLQTVSKLETGYGELETRLRLDDARLSTLERTVERLQVDSAITSTSQLVNDTNTNHSTVQMVQAQQSTLQMLETKMSALEQKIQDLQKDTTTKEHGHETVTIGPQVAVQATMLKDQPRDKSPFHFDNVMYNIGDTYNHKSGYMTVPYNGLYFVTLTTGAASASSEAKYAIMLDALQMAEGYSYRKNHLALVTTHAVMPVKKGQRIWVRKVFGNLTTDSYTTFSAFLLSPNP